MPFPYRLRHRQNLFVGTAPNQYSFPNTSAGASDGDYLAFNAGLKQFAFASLPVKERGEFHWNSNNTTTTFANTTDFVPPVAVYVAGDLQGFNQVLSTLIYTGAGNTFYVNANSK